MCARTSSRVQVIIDSFLLTLVVAAAEQDVVITFFQVLNCSSRQSLLLDQCVLNTSNFQRAWHHSICERKPASYFSCVRIGNESSTDGLTLHPPQFSICLGAPHGIASVGCRTHSFLSISYQYVLYAHAQGVFIDIIVLAD